MDINCENCGAKYTLDERLLSTSGTDVKCNSCLNVFKAFPPRQIFADPLVPWTVHTLNDKVEKFQTITELQKAIEELLIIKGDKASKFGGPWKKIEDVPQLLSFIPAGNHQRIIASPVSAGFPASNSAVRQKTMTNGKAVTLEEATNQVQEKTKNALNIKQVASKRDTVPPPPISSPGLNDKILSRTASYNIASPQKEADKLSLQIQSDTNQNTLLAMPVSGSTLSHKAVAADVADKNMISGDTINEKMISGNTIRQSLVTGDTINEKMISGNTIRQSLISGDTINEKIISGNTIRQSLISGDTISAKSENKKENSPRESFTAGATLKNQAIPSNEPDLSTIKPQKEESWQEGSKITASNDPDWTSTSELVLSDDDEVDATSKNTGKVIIFILIAAILGTGVYFGITKMDLLKNSVGEVQRTKDLKRLNKLMIEAKEDFLLDSPYGFKKAEQKYLQVLSIDKDNASALASLSMVYSAWAQYIKDDYIDTITDAESSADDTLKDNALAILKEAESKNDEASRLAKNAEKNDKNLKLVKLAMAEAELFKGNLTLASQFLQEGGSEQTITDSTYIAALIEIEQKNSREEIIGMLKSIVTAKPMLRALYRLARIQAAAGKMSDAALSLKKILTLNSRHIYAKKLLQRISENKKVVLLAPVQEEISLDSSVTDSAILNSDKVKDTMDKNTSSEKNDPSDEENTGTGGSVESILAKALKNQEKGNTGDAKIQYQEVLKKDPENIDALNGLAYLFLDTGNPGGAITNFKKAISINSRFSPAIIGMAKTYQKMGQSQVALTWFKKYLESSPTGRYATIAEASIKEIEG
ncbi:MAG: zinc-ribbon domain-containing protein, partial [Deltaproteobacteria bacterium]|nr:zinc-ribbon domain-containing protein [Deltaproteobacteria bacterium]